MLKNIKNHQFSMICGRMCFWHSKENSILQINTQKTFISSPNNFLLSTRINLVIFPCGCDHLRSTQSLKSFFNLLLRCCGDANNAINFHPRQYFPFFSLSFLVAIWQIRIFHSLTNLSISIYYFFIASQFFSCFLCSLCRWESIKMFLRWKIAEFIFAQS